MYGLAVTIRNFCYDHKILPSHGVRVPVISVGNITAGGTGKTPFVEYLVRYYLRREKKVAVVSRGYKRRSSGMVVVSDGHTINADVETAGDEPVQISKKFTRAIVIVDEQRVRGSRYAVDKFGVNVIILDDGFQHRALGRDVDIVMIDGTKNLARIQLLPAGMKREPVSSLHRATLLAVSHKSYSVGEAHGWNQFDAIPRIEVNFVPKCVRQFGNSDEMSLTTIKDKSCLAFCGIGNPQSFYDCLADSGVHIVEKLAFPDHFSYRPDDWNIIMKRFSKVNADVLITTEKDAVRLESKQLSGITYPETLYVLEIEAQIVAGETLLHKHLDETMKRDR